MKKFIAIALLVVVATGGLFYSRNNTIKSALLTLDRAHQEAVKSDSQQLSSQINDLLLHYVNIGGGRPTFSFTKPVSGLTTIKVTLGSNPKPDGAQGYIISSTLKTLSLAGLSITGSISPNTNTSGGNGAWCIVERFNNFIVIADAVGYQATYHRCVNGEAK